MFLSMESVLLAAALACVWAQDLHDNRRAKSRTKTIAANIYDGQGK